jgi:hypothetical protein
MITELPFADAVTPHELLNCPARKEATYCVVYGPVGGGGPQPVETVHPLMVTETVPEL